MSKNAVIKVDGDVPIINLGDGVLGFLDGNRLMFNAEFDKVAEYAVTSGRTDLLRLLEHFDEEKNMVVKYGPLGDRHEFPPVLTTSVTSSTGEDEPKKAKGKK